MAQSRQSGWRGRVSGWPWLSLRAVVSYWSVTARLRHLAILRVIHGLGDARSRRPRRPPKSWYAKACLHPGAPARARLRFPIRLRRPSSVPSPTALHPAFSAPASDRASPHPRLISGYASPAWRRCWPCWRPAARPRCSRVTTGAVGRYADADRAQAGRQRRRPGALEQAVEFQRDRSRPDLAGRGAGRPAGFVPAQPGARQALRRRAPGHGAAAARRTAPPGAISLVWPAQGKVTRGYDGSGSNGIVISNASGTSVVAAAAGTVAYSGSGLRGYGHLVIVSTTPASSASTRTTASCWSRKGSA